MRSFLPYAKQSISEEDIAAVGAALKEELITRGPLVQQFEQSIAEYCDVPYAVAFNSGTAALMAAYFAARINPFDRIFSTANTFIATVGIPVQMGMKPQFIDIDRASGNLNISELKNHLVFQSTRGRPFIVPVHFAGCAVDMEELDRNICHPDTIVIEDAAAALGSSYPSGQRVGSCPFSNMTIFSFHPAKIVTTGEGGMVTTRDPELYHQLRLFRDNGIERNSPYLMENARRGYYEVQAISGNFNMTSFQAALGISQLKRLDRFIAKRRSLIQRYRTHLQNVPHLTLFSDKQDHHSAFHLFVVQINYQAFQITKEKVMEALENKGIGSQVHYIPLYYHPVLRQDKEYEKQNHPETEIYYQQALSLPLYFDLKESDVDFVCQELLSILTSFK